MFLAEPTQRLGRDAVIRQQAPGDDAGRDGARRSRAISMSQCLSVRITLVRNTDSFKLS